MDGQGVPFAGVLVSAYQSDGSGGWPLVGQVLTSADGTYVLSDLPVGTYRVGFSAAGYMTKYYSDRLDPDLSWPPLYVTEGLTTSGVDVVMAPVGATTHVVGTVTDASGHGLAGIAVLAFRKGIYGWDYDQSTYTASDGSYDVDNLSGGLHILQFAGDWGTPYADQYWNGATDRDAATQLFLPIGTTTTGIDVQMELSGHISGRVTDEASGEGVGDVTVYAYKSNGKGDWPWWANVSTAADGTYDIGDLPTGTYRVEFSNWASNSCQFYDGAPTAGSASDVVVASGATTADIDAAMYAGPRGGNIGGTVADTSGTGLAGIEVIAYRYDQDVDDWDYAGDASSASDGGYLITGLPAGDYRVEFWDQTGTCATQYWEGASGFFLADDLDVQIGTTARADATLAVAGHISGRISSPSPRDLSDVCVVAYQSDSSGGWEYVNDVFASSDGTYDLSDLAPGDYRLGFEDYTGASLAQYYLGARDLDSATDVAVAEGKTTSGIDVTLAEAGHIVGLVTTEERHSIGDIEVTAYQLADGSWEPVSGAGTTAGGVYDLAGLDTGDYRIQFTDYSGRYAATWYGGQQNVATATSVAVVAGMTTSGIDATMPAAGHITGVVTNADHAGLPDIDVSAYEPDGEGGWTYAGWVMTGADGSYDLGGLGSGAYRLEFADYGNGDYFEQYFNDKGSLDAADDVPVSAGATTSGIDATLVSVDVVDTTPPTTTLNGTDGLWHNGPVTLGLSASDAPGGSGMAGGSAQTEYRLDSGDWTAGTRIVVPAPTDHSGDGEHAVLYRSTDASGNIEAAKNVTVRIDTTPPRGAFVLDGGDAATTSGTVTSGSSVTEAHGPLEMRFSADGRTSWSAWEACAAAKTIALPAGLGTKTVFAQYRDAAGNLLELSDAIELVAPPDVVPPLITAGGVTEGGWYRAGLQVALKASDDDSDIASITYTLDGVETTVPGSLATVTVPASPNARHTLTFRATDAAANSCADQTLTFTNDTSGPTNSGKSTSGRKGRNITLRYRLSDNLSPQAIAVKLIVKTSHGKKVKSFYLGTKKTAAWYSVKWKPKAKGTYRYCVYGKDLAGNAQRRVGSPKVIVR